VNDWTLSPDRRTLVIRISEPEGVRTVTLGWTDPATEQQVTDALALSYPRKLMLPGQCNTTRRVKVADGTLWVHSMTGPPTWRVPRCYRSKDGSLVVGWLRRGWALRWEREWAS
jgi:hypothetical protein